MDLALPWSPPDLKTSEKLPYEIYQGWPEIFPPSSQFVDVATQFLFHSWLSGLQIHLFSRLTSVACGSV